MSVAVTAFGSTPVLKLLTSKGAEPEDRLMTLAAAKGDLEAKIADIRSALTTDDVSRIKAAREALEQTFHKISESIYRQQGAPAGGGYDGDQAQGPNSGDETIEGDFKEV